MVLTSAYVRLGFDVPSDDGLRAIVLARIVELTSNAEFVRVLDEIGAPAVSLRTLLGRSPARDYRGPICGRKRPMLNVIDEGPSRVRSRQSRVIWIALINARFRSPETEVSMQCAALRASERTRDRFICADVRDAGMRPGHTRIARGEQGAGDTTT
jgi:hypothetical protein